MQNNEPPERLKHVFSHFDVSSESTPERANLLKDGSAYIYLIQCDEFVKIGIAENPRARCLDLQVGNPYKLKLLKAFHSRNPLIDEQRLQSRLNRYHERGEWFALPEAVLESLLTLKDDYMWEVDAETDVDRVESDIGDVGDDSNNPIRTDFLHKLKLPPRPRLCRFVVKLEGKHVHAGRVGKTSPDSSICIRVSRHSRVALSDRDQVDAAIRAYAASVEVDSRTYTIEYSKRPSITQSLSVTD